MRETSEIYVQFINAEFERRKRKNPAYSLRAFAKYLEMESSVLSAVLKQKRPLPKAKINAVASKLSLSPAEQKMFVSNARATSDLRKLLKFKSTEPATQPLTPDQIRILAEWEYFAVLALIETQDRFQRPEQIAERLGLSHARVKKVLSGLISENFLKLNSAGNYEISAENGFFSADSKSMHQATQQSLEIALKRLPVVPEGFGYFNSVTLAIDRSRIREATELFRDFRRRICALLEEGPKNEVYKFNIQLFPLTTIVPESALDVGEGHQGDADHPHEKRI